MTSVLSDVDAEPEGKGAVVRVPDLLADEVRHVVLAVELALHAGPTAGPVTVFEVEGRYAEQHRPEPDLDPVVAQAELVRAQIAPGSGA